MPYTFFDNKMAQELPPIVVLKPTPSAVPLTGSCSWCIAARGQCRLQAVDGGLVRHSCISLYKL